LTHGLVILCSGWQSSEMGHHCLSFPVSRFEAMPSVMSWSGKPRSLLSLGLCEWLSARYLRIQICDSGIAAVARRAWQIRPSVATAEENLYDQRETVPGGFRSGNFGRRGYLVVLKYIWSSLLQNLFVTQKSEKMPGNVERREKKMLEKRQKDIFENFSMKSKHILCR